MAFPGLVFLPFMRPIRSLRSCGESVSISMPLTKEFLGAFWYEDVWIASGWIARIHASCNVAPRPRALKQAQAQFALPAAAPRPTTVRREGQRKPFTAAKEVALAVNLE